MLAYKFLLPGAVGPFSGFAWPAPGTWVTASEELVPCRAGVHGCLVEHLPWWLQDELWAAEFAEPVTQVHHKVVAGRARLVRRIAAWDAPAVGEFAAACARSARDRAVGALEEADAPGPAERLRGCRDPHALRDVAQGVRAPEPARVSVAMLADAAQRAITGPAATAAYIAAHAARIAAGDEAMAAERRWQSDWLHQLIGE